MTIATANEQIKGKFTHGYGFARACMRCVAKENKLIFEPKDNYPEDMEDYNMPILIKAVIKLLLLQQEQYVLAARCYSNINTRSQFRDYCITELCPMVFITGYSSMNFLNFLAWITLSAIDFKKKYLKDYLFDAMLIIGDVLDIFMENCEFELAGSWIDLYSTAETLDKDTVRNYLRVQRQVMDSKKSSQGQKLENMQPRYGRFLHVST